MLSTQARNIPADPHDPYVVVARGLPPSRTAGAVTLMVATPVHNETAVIREATLALGGLALFLLAGLLWLIHRVLTAALGRVESIRASVAEIRASRSEVRVPVPAGGDEITHLAETMNEMLDRLHDADRAQRAFVSDASHELRSPLTAIRMISETSPEGIDPGGTAVVHAEALRLQRLVEDLLTLAKADDQGVPLDRAEVDIDDLLTDELHRLRAMTTLQITADIAPVRVLGDPARLTQVIRNISDNAVRHARHAIHLADRSEGNGVMIVIDNDGDPVPVERREAIFDRFTRLHEARDRDSGGSGLGLAIVRSLVDSHGGRVRTTDSPAGWCRFEVWLPAEGQPEGADLAGGSRHPHRM